ncbi:MAG: rod shape-determining protein MreD [Clostridiales bacterium]|nr:rod shape-determining protein MreD [Clostridiales bacterium]
MKRTFIYIVVILGAFLLQSAVFSFFALADIVPNLLIIVTASIALIRGQSEGCVVGFFCGLLMDISVGYYLGINALCFLVIGFVLGYLNQIYYEEDITLPLILIGVADFLYGIIMYILSFMARGRFDFLYYLGRIILPELVYTVILSIVAYRFILFICKKLDKKGSEDLIA